MLSNNLAGQQLKSPSNSKSFLNLIEANHIKTKTLTKKLQNDRILT